MLSRFVSPHLKFKSGKLHSSPACVDINTHLPLCMCPYVFSNVLLLLLLHRTTRTHIHYGVLSVLVHTNTGGVRKGSKTDRKQDTDNVRYADSASISHAQEETTKEKHSLHTIRGDKRVWEREIEWQERSKKNKSNIFFRCPFVYCCCALFRSSDLVEDDSVCMLWVYRLCQFKRMPIDFRIVCTVSVKEFLSFRVCVFFLIRFINCSVRIEVKRFILECFIRAIVSSSSDNH